MTLYSILKYIVQTGRFLCRGFARSGYYSFFVRYYYFHLLSIEIGPLDHLIWLYHSFQCGLRTALRTKTEIWNLPLIYWNLTLILYLFLRSQEFWLKLSEFLNFGSNYFLAFLAQIIRILAQIWLIHPNTLTTIPTPSTPTTIQTSI
jgi:hypothetical protein